MRTTIDIEDDVFLATKELARMQKKSAGKVISHLLRSAILQTNNQSEKKTSPIFKNFSPFPAQGALINNEQIDALRDSEGL